MKTKRFAIILCCVMLAAFALGVAGALKITNGNLPSAEGSDRMVGLLITTEWLGTSGAETGEAQGRIYARFDEDEFIDPETGATYPNGEFFFDGVDGIRFFTACVGEGDRAYWKTNIDEGIAEVHQNIDITDDGTNNTSLKGTLYAAGSDESAVFYLNPVFQTASGEVYAVSGESCMFGGEGMSQSTKISNKSTVTADGEEKTVSTEVEITLCTISVPTGTTVLQFGAEHELLDRAEYSPGKLPEHIKTQSGTQYIIVESASADGVERTIVQKTDALLHAPYCREGGICVMQACEVEWTD